MSPLETASAVLIAAPALGLGGAAVFAVARRGRTSGVPPQTVLARAGSYAALAAILLAAGHGGVPGIAVLFGLLGAIALLEWAHLFDLPLHHRVALLATHAIVVTAIAIDGVDAADWLVGMVVLVGAAWPVVRPDTDRAVRDLGNAAVGAVVITVLLAHGVALASEHGEAGIVLVLALAVACAGADVAAFVVGRAIGRHPLAPRLSPNKTWEGLVGSVIGAAVGLAPFVPALAPVFGQPFLTALVPLVAAGAVWGDLLESAAKREAGTKDAARWLPGFGGILDRIDSLLVTVALGYWIARLWGAGGS